MAQPSLILTDNAPLYVAREVEKSETQPYFAFMGTESFIEQAKAAKVEGNFTSGTLFNGAFDPPYSAPEYRHSWRRSLVETLRGGPDDVILSGSQLFGSTKGDPNGIGSTLALIVDGGHSVTLVYPGIAFKEIVRQSSRVRAMVPTDLQPSIVFFGD